MNKVIQLLADCSARIFTMCDAKSRRHTRPVLCLFSQWYGLVHNKFVRKNDVSYQRFRNRFNDIARSITIYYESLKIFSHDQKTELIKYIDFLNVKKNKNSIEKDFYCDQQNALKRKYLISFEFIDSNTKLISRYLNVNYIVTKHFFFCIFNKTFKLHNSKTKIFDNSLKKCSQFRNYNKNFS